jgi:antitoxin HigA-1
MARVRKRKPVHPGKLFKVDVMDELELTVTETAQRLGISRKHLSAFVNEKVPCSAEMAQRIARATGTSMQSWLNMQATLDVWEAEQHPREDIVKIKPFAA